MNREAFQNYREEFADECHKVLFAKSKDYAADSDALVNFKRNAQLTGMRPLQVWAIYFMKHIDAILAYVREGKAESEPIRGRFCDARNYIDLGIALVEEGGGSD